MPVVTTCHHVGAASCVVLAPMLVGSASEAAPVTMPGGPALLASKKVAFNHTPSEAKAEFPGSGTAAGDAHEQLPACPSAEAVVNTIMATKKHVTERLKATAPDMLAVPAVLQLQQFDLRPKIALEG